MLYIDIVDIFLQREDVPMLHIINAQDVINMDSETHYACHSQIDDTQYPQIHDFYELSFIVSGSMNYILNEQKLTLQKGNLVFVRPKDTHVKIATGACEHINLAFPEKTLTSLFRYLYDLDAEKVLHGMEHVPVCSLTHYETIYLHDKLIRLNLIPIASTTLIKAYLRTLLAEIVSQYIMPEIESKKRGVKGTVLPLWLEQALHQLKNIDDLSAIGMDYLADITGKSQEYLCRAFQKYLHVTPASYINELRLNYAANLLVHTDKKIIDIAFESGFQSLSYFHHLFKREFDTTPLKFRNSSFKYI